MSKTMTAPAPVLSRINSDRDLAARCSNGDKSAQRQLFAEYKTRAHATLFRILGSNRDMEDLVQDCFLEIFTSLRRFRGDARLATWISRICTRVAYRYLRKKQATPILQEMFDESVADIQNVDELVVSKIATQALYRALDKINLKRRIAFALHVIDGRPMREVALLTESSLVSTKSRVWRARRELERFAKKDPTLAGYLAIQEKQL